MACSNSKAAGVSFSHLFGKQFCNVGAPVCLQCVSSMPAMSAVFARTACMHQEGLQYWHTLSAVLPHTACMHQEGWIQSRGFSTLFVSTCKELQVCMAFVSAVSCLNWRWAQSTCSACTLASPCHEHSADPVFYHLTLDGMTAKRGKEWRAPDTMLEPDPCTELKALSLCVQ
eukprot:scaffold5434_cov24-Tisochrysis_lutea.AAC.1